MSSRVSFAQNNLVLNGDFEQYSKCPYDVDQIMLATGWTPIDTLTKHADGSGNNDCSPEYCHVCGTGVANTVPNNNMGYQYPRSVRGMAAIYLYTDIDSSATWHYLRDYLQGRLTKKLTAGKTYCVSFYVVLAEVSDWAVKEISAYLDNGAIDATPFCGIPQTKYTPQITNSSGPITDTMNWTKIEGSFVATGNERFITIGNFKDKTHTTVTNLPIKSGNGYRITYYLVDDVSVVASDAKADAGPDTHVGAGDSVFIGYRDMALDCYWTVLGSSAVIGKGAGIWVKPSGTTSYILTQTVCGVLTKDTVKVEVWKAGVTSINGQTQHYSVAPNPSDGTVTLSQSLHSAAPVSIKVYGVIGNLVHSATLSFTDGSATLNLSDIAYGIYYIMLRDASGTTYKLNFVKQ